MKRGKEEEERERRKEKEGGGRRNEQGRQRERREGRRRQGKRKSRRMVYNLFPSLVQDWVPASKGPPKQLVGKKKKKVPNKD